MWAVDEEDLRAPLPAGPLIDGLKRGLVCTGFIFVFFTLDLNSKILTLEFMETAIVSSDYPSSSKMEVE